MYTAWNCWFIKSKPIYVPHEKIFNVNKLLLQKQKVLQFL